MADQQEDQPPPDIYGEEDWAEGAWFRAGRDPAEAGNGRLVLRMKHKSETARSTTACVQNCSWSRLSLSMQDQTKKERQHAHGYIEANGCGTESWKCILGRRRTTLDVFIFLKSSAGSRELTSGRHRSADRPDIPDHPFLDHSYHEYHHRNPPRLEPYALPTQRRRPT
ncbi:uncharacterized protein B0I36DRAFT_355437 [Microdochium trichocladiopsis]|uniref:Uncharacterized protein n=1 Tax=Microdochium trichocladiopsis TaxID=1682393 RepID=A0A9P8XS31_9PEZI|nr:uncharacterized protein B0I36DRAFT_355437 [Microdochium trichocladiopsis]KAH7014185.1 hypothetical protein B0I36DRAFT_355437 [Microdochium trichocladiopsis]